MDDKTKSGAAPDDTPWGKKQFDHEVIEGVRKVETSGHGGLWLDERQRAQIPDYLKEHSAGKDGTWWEEDCAWSLPVVHLLSQKQQLNGHEDFLLESAKETAEEWYPEEYKKMMEGAQKDKAQEAWDRMQKQPRDRQQDRGPERG